MYVRGCVCGRHGEDRPPLLSLAGWGLGLPPGRRFKWNGMEWNTRSLKNPPQPLFFLQLLKNLDWREILPKKSFWSIFLQRRRKDEMAKPRQKKPTPGIPGKLGTYVFFDFDFRTPPFDALTALSPLLKKIFLENF